MADLLTKELEWWSNSEDRHLGLVLYEREDNQYLWMILGRDKRKLYRGVDMRHSYDLKDNARQDLIKSLSDWENRKDKDCYQGDEEIEKNEIFIDKTVEDKLHPYYKILRDSPSYSSAKGIIKELAYAFTDLDGNYVKDFQTKGFNSRLWELSLFAFFHEQKFLISEEFDRPDFHISKGGFPIAVEATTINPSESGKLPPSSTKEEKQLLNQGYMQIRYARALGGKLRKRYWELEHMKNAPFILAIHDFHLADSMTWSSTALHEYLFGLKVTIDEGKPKFEQIESHTWNTKSIPSNFFAQPEAKHISAVIFSNAATLSKFNRIGKIANFGNSAVKIRRIGYKLNTAPDALLPKEFVTEIEEGKYHENWSDGIRVFHNPNASTLIPEELFPLCSHHYSQNGELKDYWPEDFIFSSKTEIVGPK